MCSFFLQLAIFAILIAGPGYWTWLVCGRPNPWRGLTWLWCGLAGFCLHCLALQALIYVDVPVSRSAPWALLFAAAGLVGGLTEWVRRRRAVPFPLRSDLIAGSGTMLAAAMLITFVFWRDIPDRFIARRQPDQWNYFTTAQAIADEKYSLRNDDIGLRPWLFRTITTKHERLTECVVLAAVAVDARTDCQRAWLGVSVGFLALLAGALYGFGRNVAGLPPLGAAAAAVAGSFPPAIGVILANGYFSQLSTLWVLAALPAAGRPGALGGVPRAICTLAFGGFLAGAYTEFFPIGAMMIAAMLLAANKGWRARLAEIALVLVGALLATTGYLRDLPHFLGGQLDAGSRAQFLPNIAPDSATWVGWCRLFYSGPRWWIGIAATTLVAIVGVGCLAIPRHRLRWLLLAFAGPMAILLCLLAQPGLPTYAFHKLTAALAPLLIVAAAAAIFRPLIRFAPRWRGATAVVGALLLLTIPASGIVEFNKLRVPGDLLWDARGRIEGAGPQTYLIGERDPNTAGWLAYFARNSRVYSTLPSISDRRTPSETFEFRRVPEDIHLQWLAVERRGAVGQFEASPHVAVLGAIEQHHGEIGSGYLVGAASTIEIYRHALSSGAPRNFSLEIGITPATGQPLQVAVAVKGRPPVVSRVEGPTLLRIPLSLTDGRNVCAITCTTAGEIAPGGVMAVLQSLNLVSDAAW